MEFMGPAHNFAKRHRALGLGVMGFHSYLQKKMIPIESFDANMINAQMFKNISAKATAASIEIGNAMGFAPIFDEGDTTDTKRRNTTTMAIAPTTSSSSILGQASPGIEPYSSNYYKAGLAKGNFMRKNKYLAKLLADKGMDNEDVWRSIMLNHGSILHLDDSILNEHEKSVFKTFTEISQMQLIKLAAQRQTFIDQMQSVNLKIPSTLPVKDVNNLMITAWEDGVKSIYYQRSTSVSKELMTNMVLCNSCEA
jgi:ribonucleoside-diphosphate reductase alpha chain